MANDFTARFGKHLRVLRRSRGWTQEALAKRSELSVDGIRRLEAGGFSPSLSTLEKLSLALGIRLSTIIAALETSPKRSVRELCDHLESLPPKELRTAARLLYALAEPRRPQGGG